jgi:hypothetical protein
MLQSKSRASRVTAEASDMPRPYRVQLLGRYAGIVFAYSFNEARKIAKESFGPKARIA